MENLDYTSDHLPNLVEQERLTLEIESDKLNSIRVVSIRDSKSFTVNIHVLVGLHVHHIPLSRHLVRFDLFSKVVILFGSLEAFPAYLDLLTLALRQPYLLHLLPLLY